MKLYAIITISQALASYMGHLSLLALLCISKGKTHVWYKKKPVKYIYCNLILSIWTIIHWFSTFHNMSAWMILQLLYQVFCSIVRLCNSGPTKSVSLNKVCSSLHIVLTKWFKFQINSKLQEIDKRTSNFIIFFYIQFFYNKVQRLIRILTPVKVWKVEKACVLCVQVGCNISSIAQESNIL